MHGPREKKESSDAEVSLLVHTSQLLATCRNTGAKVPVECSTYADRSNPFTAYFRAKRILN